jgi:hypothetical protein
VLGIVDLRRPIKDAPFTGEARLLEIRRDLFFQTNRGQRRPASRRSKRRLP